MLVLSITPGIAQPAGDGRPVPSFEELEAAGAIIGEIRIDNQNVFNTDDPREDYALFRLANSLHIRTRPGTIQRVLLFKSGEPLSARLIEESERLLHGNQYIYDVRIRPVAYRNGIVDIEVTTRDTWTLSPDIRFSRQGGRNTTGLGLKEANLFGTGIVAGVTHLSDADRSGTEFILSRNNAFDGRTIVDYRDANFSDGQRRSFALDRPFYALDTRWAAGVAASTDDRITSIYSGGNILSQYRQKSESGMVYGGWSNGLVDGWTHRYSAGIQYQNDAYLSDPSLPQAAGIPADLKMVGPFLSYEVVEDDYRKVRNRNRIERTEYFALGFRSRLHLGRALTSLGSTRDLWLYSAGISQGLTFFGDHNFLASANASGRYGSGGGELQHFGASGSYYHPQKGNRLLFVSVSAHTVANGGASDQLLLGGENGLRGYPLRYQTGTNRVIVSVEQRAYTNWYPFRLFRIGGAIFFDVGRAWSGENQNTVNPGWLQDAGFGLRIAHDRSSTGKVTHIDLAFPLGNPDASIKSYQFSIKTRSTF